MANICNTSVKFYSQNKNEINKLYEVLYDIYINEVHYNPWVGKLLKLVGYTEDDMNAGKCGYCRSWLCWLGDIDNDGDFYTLDADMEDAWTPNIEPWRLAIDRLIPDNKICIAWYAEEPGCELYQKYDKCKLFEDIEYCLDVCEPSIPMDKYNWLESCIYTEAELIHMFNVDTIKEVFLSVNDIDELFSEHDGFVSLHKFEEVDEEF